MHFGKHTLNKDINMEKSITIKGLCIAIAFTVTGFMAQAQLTNSVYLDFGLPTGSFHSNANNLQYSDAAYILTKENIGKCAGMGIGFGYRASYRFDVGFGNVDPFLSVDLFWNRVKGDVRDAIIDHNGKSSHYINVPILLGVQYNYAISDVLRPFAEFGVGYDVVNVGSEGWKGGDASHPEYYWAKYSVKGAMAFQIGAGCYFGEHVSASLNFYGLGKHTINYKDASSDALRNPVVYERSTVNGSIIYNTDGTPKVDAAATAAAKEFATNNVQRRIGLLALRIGFHF